MSPPPRWLVRQLGGWGEDWLRARTAVWLGEVPHPPPPPLLPSLGEGTMGEEGGLQSSSGQLVTGRCTFSSSSPRPSTHSEHPPTAALTPRRCPSSFPLPHPPAAVRARRDAFNPLSIPRGLVQGSRSFLSEAAWRTSPASLSTCRSSRFTSLERR